MTSIMVEPGLIAPFLGELQERCSEVLSNGRVEIRPEEKQTALGSTRLTPGSYSADRSQLTSPQGLVVWTVRVRLAVW
jgi:hypothetical protein